jgi:hypothetical protein
MCVAAIIAKQPVCDSVAPCREKSLMTKLSARVVQLFQKVPALKALAPTQSEPPFAVTQLVVLALFVLLAIIAAIRFRGEQLRRA